MRISERIHKKPARADKEQSKADKEQEAEIVEEEVAEVGAAASEVGAQKGSSRPSHMDEDVVPIFEDDQGMESDLESDIATKRWLS